MNERHSTSWAVAFAIVFPTVVTWIYFIALAGQPSAIQQTAYSVGKVIQFAFPAVWVFLIRRRAVAFSRPVFTGVESGVPYGIGFGVAVGIAMTCAYFYWLKPAGLFSGDAGDAIRAKVTGLRIDATWKFAALSAFYALGHSALEEYYWRWFVFGRLRTVTSLSRAVVLSSLGFMAHHVLLLAHFFGWQSPVTWLFSAGVAIGGAVWAGLYHRYRSLVGPWLSHLLVDAAIFAIGYDLVRESWQ